MSTWLDRGLFGSALRFLSRGSAVSNRPSVNFASPLIATDNSGANRTDVSIDGMVTGPATATVAGEVPTFEGTDGVALARGPLIATTSAGNSLVTPRIAGDALELAPGANGAGAGPPLRLDVGTGASAATRGNVWLGFRSGEGPSAQLGAGGALLMKHIGTAPSGGTYSGERALYPKSDGWYESDGTTERKLAAGMSGAGAGTAAAVVQVDATGNTLSRTGVTSDGAGSLTFGTDGTDQPTLLFSTPTAGRKWGFSAMETSSYGLTNSVIGWGHNFGPDTLPLDPTLRSAGINIELSYKKADDTINTEVYLKVTEAGDATLSGSTASVTAKSGDIVTVTGMTGLTSAMVGKSFAFGGAASSGNNGTFKMFAHVSATSAKFINANGVASDANNGAITWSAIQHRLWAPNYDHTNHVGVVGYAAGQQIFATDNVTTLVDMRSDALTLLSGATATITTKVGDVVTLTGMTGLASTNVGNYVRLQGCTSAGNNGYFPIASVLSSSSCTITNAGGVASDAASGSIAWVVWRQPQGYWTGDQIIAQGYRLVVNAAAPSGVEQLYVGGTGVVSGGITVGDSVAPVETLTVRGSLSFGTSATDGFAITQTASHTYKLKPQSHATDFLERLDFGVSSDGSYQSMSLNWNYGAGAGLLRINMNPTSFRLQYGGANKLEMDGTGLGAFNHAPAAQSADIGAIPTLTDSPASADALRDDINTNWMPWFAALRTHLRAHGWMA